MDVDSDSLPVGWQSNISLTESFYTMFETELLTDVTFTFKTDEDTVEVKAHRLVLAARSPVFQVMFYGQLKTEDKVHIEDISADSFKLFISCLYRDDEDLDEDSAKLVIEAAHTYQVDILVNRCSDVLCNSIRVDNACQILQYAVFYNLKKLKRKALDFIDDNAAKILETPEFMELPNETLKLILSGDTFYTDEMKIVEKMFEWAAKKCTEQGIEQSGIHKRRALGDTFFYLRLPTLPLSDFTKYVAKAGFLTQEEELSIYRHMGSPSSQEAICTSIIPRAPRKCHSKYMTKYRGIHSRLTNIKTSITISCQKDIFLTMVDYEADIIKGFGIVRPNDIVFSAKVSIPKLNAKLSYRKMCQYISSKYIILENPIFLRKNDGPYEMIMEVECMNDHKAECFQSFDNGQDSISVDTNAPDTCSFTYNDNIRFIKGLTFLNCSNR
ncbi:hypothetical protein CHS0354_009353 [Potamilus streckersoni]|nr:hypothetical protein CHS0354_009353 [Potamilus streckersoni]